MKPRSAPLKPLLLLLLATSAFAVPAQGQGNPESRVNRVVRGVTAFALELAMIDAAAVELESAGLTTLSAGPVVIGLSRVEVKDTTGVRVHGYLHNPTGQDVAIPLLGNDALVLVDEQGRRIDIVSGVRVQRLPKRAREITVPALERVSFSILFGAPAPDASRATLKVGGYGMIGGIPVRMGVAAEGGSRTAEATAPPPPTSTPEPDSTPSLRPAPQRPTGPARPKPRPGAAEEAEPKMEEAEHKVDQEAKPKRVVRSGSATCAPGVSPAAALPGSWVTLTRVPAGFTEATATATATVRAEGAEAVEAVVERTGDTLRVAVPFHPTGGAEGGAVELVLSNDSQSCSPVALRVEPLPAVPAGTAERLVTQFEAAAEALAAPAVGAQAAGPEGVVNVGAFLREVLNGENNPNSLRRMIDGTAPLLGGERVDPVLLDRAMAASGLPQAIEALERVARAAPTSLAPPTPLTRFAAAPSAFRAPFASDAAWPELLPRAAAQGCVLAGGKGGCYGHDLNRLLLERQKWDVFLLKETQDKFNAYNMMVSTIGMIGGAAKPIQVASFIAGTGTFALGTTAEVLKSLLPSELSTVDAKLSTTQLTLGTEPVGQIRGVRVRAKSQTFDLSGVALLDLALGAKGVAGGFKISAAEMIAKKRKWLDALGSNEELLEKVESFSEYKTNMALLAMKLIFPPDFIAQNLHMGQIAKVGQIDWGWYELDSSDFTIVGTVPNTVVKADPRGWGFHAVAPGTAKVTVKTDPSRLPVVNTYASVTYQVKVAPKPKNAPKETGLVPCAWDKNGEVTGWRWADDPKSKCGGVS